MKIRRTAISRESHGPTCLSSFGLDLETSFVVSQLFTASSKSAGQGSVAGRAGGDLDDRQAGLWEHFRGLGTSAQS